MITYVISQREYLVYSRIYKILKIKDAVETLWLIICAYKLLIYLTFRKFRIGTYRYFADFTAQTILLVAFDSTVNSPLCVSFCRFVVKRNLAMPIRSPADSAFVYRFNLLCADILVFLGCSFGYIIIKIFM